MLEDAYRNTTYEAHTPGGTIEIRIGAPCPLLDDLLATVSPRTPSWAYVTAWNPGSQLLPEAENRARNRELARVARDLCATCYRGAGRGADSSWEPEESLLLLGIERATAVQLGLRFGQNAIVFGERGKEAELLWCRQPGDGPPAQAQRASATPSTTPRST